jgi:hypothetical protein
VQSCPWCGCALHILPRGEGDDVVSREVLRCDDPHVILVGGITLSNLRQTAALAGATMFALPRSTENRGITEGAINSGREGSLQRED